MPPSIKNIISRHYETPGAADGKDYTETHSIAAAVAREHWRNGLPFEGVELAAKAAIEDFKVRISERTKAFSKAKQEERYKDARRKKRAVQLTEKELMEERARRKRFVATGPEKTFCQTRRRRPRYGDDDR